MKVLRYLFIMLTKVSLPLRPEGRAGDYPAGGSGITGRVSGMRN